MPQLATSTVKQRRQHLKAHVLPALGNIPCKDVTADDIVALIDGVAKKSTPNVAELVLTAIREVYKYAEEGRGVKMNPSLGLKAHAITGMPEKTRERLNLSEAELRALLPRLDLLGRQNALAVRIQLATCCRIGELARAEWTDVDLENGRWVIPEKNSKTKIPFTVPLPPAVVAWFKELQLLACGSNFVLPARQRRRQRTHGKPMHYEPRALNSMLNKVIPNLEGVRLFTPHDLRSTARSHLSALGVGVIVAEKCLNHSLGGLLETYDKYDYFEERRSALMTWTDFLLACEVGREWRKLNASSAMRPAA